MKIKATVTYKIGPYVVKHKKYYVADKREDTISCYDPISRSSVFAAIDTWMKKHSDVIGISASTLSGEVISIEEG